LSLHNSLNTGDVFILDAGLKLYLFNGAKANHAEKARGVEMIAKIKVCARRSQRTALHCQLSAVYSSSKHVTHMQSFQLLLKNILLTLVLCVSKLRVAAICLLL
jgi:hypothetical protein